MLVSAFACRNVSTTDVYGFIANDIFGTTCLHWAYLFELAGGIELDEYLSDGELYGNYCR